MPSKIKSRLKLCIPLLREAAVMTKAMKDGRLLLSLEEKRELQDLALSIEAHGGVIDSILNGYQLIGAGGKKMANITK
jgi:hypothetical protein